MDYFYSAGVMGYGEGRSWHKYFNFPKFPIVTKTLTIKPKIGCPFAILKSGKTVWNRVSLHNIGIDEWYYKHYVCINDNIVSIAGTDDEVQEMVKWLNNIGAYSIELNFSCPNVKSFKNKRIPESHKPLYLKLNHLQDPYDYDLDKIIGIRLNSVPKFYGGISGKMAQQYNWPWIEKFNKEGLNVVGSSCVCVDDLKHMEAIGCKEIGIGSMILINPKLVEGL